MRKLAVVLAATLVALPGGAAFGQSAGDEQYADPFDDPPARSEGPERVAGAPATPPAQPGASAERGSASQAQAPAQARAQLPRTGYDVPLLFVAGAVLLLSGVSVRRVTRPPPARL